MARLGPGGAGGDGGNPYSKAKRARPAMGRSGLRTLGRNRFIAPLCEADGTAALGRLLGAIKRLRPASAAGQASAWKRPRAGFASTAARRCLACHLGPV